jgi:phosphoglycolate phosphatase
MLEFLRKKGYQISNFDENMRTQALIDEAQEEWRQSAMLQKTPFDVIKQGLFRILDQLELDALKDSKPFSESIEMVTALKRHGLLTGVVTNTGRIPAISVLSRFGFLSYLDTVVSRDEAARMKPSPDMLNEAKRQLGLRSCQILYVGDSLLDIEAARAAEMSIASVPTGSYSKEQLKTNRPDFMLETVHDLERIIKENRS